MSLVQFVQVISAIGIICFIALVVGIAIFVKKNQPKPPAPDSPAGLLASRFPYRSLNVWVYDSFLHVHGIRRETDRLIIGLTWVNSFNHNPYFSLPPKEAIYLLDTLGKEYKMLQHTAVLPEQGEGSPRRLVPADSSYPFEVHFEPVPYDQFQIIWGNFSLYVCMVKRT